MGTSNLGPIGQNVILGGRAFEIWDVVSRSLNWQASCVSRGFSTNFCQLLGYYDYEYTGGMYYFPVENSYAVMRMDPGEFTHTGLVRTIAAAYRDPARAEIVWNANSSVWRTVPGVKAQAIVGKSPVFGMTGQSLPASVPVPPTPFMMGGRIQINQSVLAYGVAPNKTVDANTLPAVATVARTDHKYVYFVFDGLPGMYYIEKMYATPSTLPLPPSGVKREAVAAFKKTNPDGCECGGYAAGFRKGQEGHAQWCPARSQRLIDIDMRRAIVAVNALVK